MANGAPPARRRTHREAAKAKPEHDTGARAFDADARRAEREGATATIEGVVFRRRRKDWGVSRGMRRLMREQESAVALGNRLRVRVSELEAEQVEAAAKGEDETVETLEGQITELVDRSDDATEDAELVAYRLLALLLVPPDEGTPEGFPADGWGPDEEGGPLAAEDAMPAVEFLQPALDVEDAAALARELTGSQEPDPPTTPSSESGSS